MAAKKFKTTIGGKSYTTMANSAEQAARRAEKAHKASSGTVNQKTNIANVTRRNVAERMGAPEAKGHRVAPIARKTVGRSPAQKAALKKAQSASAAARRKR